MFYPDRELARVRPRPKARWKKESATLQGPTPIADAKVGFALGFQFELAHRAEKKTLVGRSLD